jgi:dTDP-4-amino-4,6-dideoxy-D-galactose acyltransferase
MIQYNALEFLEWDSKFFGKKIAKIEFADIANNASIINTKIANSSFDLIYCFVPEKESNVEDVIDCIVDATWVDGKVTFVKKVDEKLGDVNESVLSVNAMSDSLYSLAIKAGVFSRYHIDPNFEPGQYIRLYEKWIENSVNRSLAIEVFAFIESGNTLGMITIGEKNNRADIGLLGIDSSIRRKGIASTLLKVAEQFAQKRGYKELQVVTQIQNGPACKLYEKYGFKKEAIVNIFHVWKKNEIKTNDTI